MTEPIAARRTFLSRVALPAFSWGLPFHSLIVAFLFGGLGLSASTVRGFAAWKEVFVICLLAYIVMRAAFGRGPRIAISWIDIAVGGLLFLAAAFFVAGKSWLRIELPPGSELYGIRDIAFFLFLYFIGRASPEIVDDPATLRRLYIVVVMTSAIAIVEWLFVTPEQLVLLGVAAYFQKFLNVAAFTAGNQYGLPMNYWTHIGSVEVQRAGSIYLSSQAFAVPFIILMPVATAWVFGVAKRRTASMYAEYAIVWLGLLLSITRMTAIVCAIQVLLMIVLLRRPEWAVAALVAGCVAILVAMVAVPGLPGFIWDTLTWQTGSSASHIKDWSKGVAALFEHPLGWGLGTTDQSAVRFGLEPLTADNAYFKYAVELGLQGLLLHLLIFAALAYTGLKVFRRASTRERRLMGLVVFVTTIGILINATTGVVFNALVLSYLYFWFAGAVVTIAQRDAALVSSKVPARLELAPA
jgi:hypothetical protein